MDALILVLVLVGVGLLCLVGVGAALIRIFPIDRRKPLKISVHLRYLPNKRPELDPYQPDKKPLSKRAKRNQRHRNDVVQKDSDANFSLEDTAALNRKKERDAIRNKLQMKDKEKSNKLGLFSRLSSKFIKTKIVSSTDESSITDDIETGNNFKPIKIIEGASTKSKRFASQDRLNKAEARKLLVKPAKTDDDTTVESSVTHMERDPVSSLLDVEWKRKERATAALENRLMIRKEWKEDRINNNFIDHVKINSGPPMSMVPKGYRLNDEIGSILLSPEFLIYKRVLYKWEQGERKAQGWYIGTIVGVSKAPGCNFAIKYDREETKNIFVDGLKPVNLQLSGDTAYGLRWVVLIRVAPGKFSKAIFDEFRQ